MLQFSDYSIIKKHKSLTLKGFKYISRAKGRGEGGWGSKRVAGGRKRREEKGEPS